MKTATQTASHLINDLLLSGAGRAIIDHGLRIILNA